MQTAEQLQEKTLLKDIHLVEAFNSNDFAAITTHLSLKGSYGSYGSPLHLAISLSNKHTVENLIEYWNLDILTWINLKNTPNMETPLHIASKLGRTELIDMLFQIASIDDTIRDSLGRVAIEVAKNERMAEYLIAKREEFVNEILKTLRSCMNDANGGERIMSFFNSHSRANEYLKLGWIDINAPIDIETEQGLLHFAAKNDDAVFLKWALDRGADANVKDKRGKLPSKLLSKKDVKLKDTLKHAISQAPILSSSLVQAISSQFGATSQKQSPTMKGNFLKWTNYAIGYKSRFFVLENGILSYYKCEADYPVSCRGSISILIADVELPDSNDRSRFDVITGKDKVSYSLKARSPADAKKWVWAIKETKTFMIDHAKQVRDSQTSGKSLLDDVEDDDEDFERSLSAKQSHDDGLNKRSFDARESITSRKSHDEQQYIRRGSDAQPNHKSEIEMPVTTTEDLATLLYLLDVQLEVQQRIIDGVIERASSSFAALHEDEEFDIRYIPSFLASARAQVNKTVAKIVAVTESREKKWLNKWKRERESKMRWESIVKDIMEGNEEIVMAAARRKQGNAGEADIPFESPTITVSGPATAIPSVEYETDEDIFYDADDETARFSADEIQSDQLEQSFGFAPRQSSSRIPTASIGVAKLSVSPYSIMEALKGYPLESRNALPIDPSKSTKPSLNVWSFLKSAIVTLPVFFNEPLSMLQRMCEDVEYIELLSLAARVGAPNSAKDNTTAKAAAQKLGLSLSDLESLEGDEASVFRLMLVAAFAMSNYSSTVDRTSKPFNPMLGETYELVNKEKDYRYISEQVCHHPPVSAYVPFSNDISSCHCESPDYNFWTEVNVKSKFWGKSLELHPLGVCHVELPVGDAVEHFSWRKVTTSVNNLIVGTLWIEHYGDMVVRNWKTGEEAILTFKPKSSGGWFGFGAKAEKSADENVNSGGHIIGKVKDINGVIRYELKGKWDSELRAQSVAPMKAKFLSGGPITLWRRNPIPSSSSRFFDFTYLALAMNELPESLRKNLPTTDSRLRPLVIKPNNHSDQRALEEGHWNEANEFKETLERRQREERKTILKKFQEDGIPNGPQDRHGISVGEEWWIPRWFVRSVDQDTQEQYWKFTNDYWEARAEAASGKSPWPEWIPDLFGMPKDEKV